MQKNLIDFSKKNPQLKVETQYLPNRHPILIAEYSFFSFYGFLVIENGQSRQVCVKNMSQKEIWEHVTIGRSHDN